MSQWSGGRVSPFTLLGLLIIAVLGGIVAVSTMQLSALKFQVADKQRMVQTLTAQNQELQVQRTNAETQQRELEGRLNDARSQLASANGELGRLRASLTEAQERFDALAGERVQAEAKTAQLTQERNQAQEQLRRLTTEKQNLKRAATRMRERFALLDRDYQRVVNQLEMLERHREATPAAPPSSAAPEPSPSPEPAKASELSPAQPPQAAPQPVTPQAPFASSRTVELPPIVVRKGQTAAPTQIRGRVVEVDEAYHFAVIDKGSADGVILGMVFDIMRGTTAMGRVQVVRIRPKLSACDVMASKTLGPLRAGDVAVQQDH